MEVSQAVLGRRSHGLACFAKAARRFCLTVMAALSIAAAAAADQIEVLLPGETEPRILSRSELMELPVTEYVTSTVWTEGVSHFSGVLLRDLLVHLNIPLDAPPARVVLTAFDGYSAAIEFDEITESAPMISYLRDHAPMPLREQGPFWLIFPFDDSPVYRSETHYALSIWQISEISIEE